MGGGVYICDACVWLSVSACVFLSECVCVCVCVFQDPLSLWPLEPNLEKLIHPLLAHNRLDPGGRYVSVVHVCSCLSVHVCFCLSVCVCVLQDPLSLWTLEPNLEKLIHPLLAHNRLDPGVCICGACERLSVSACVFLSVCVCVCVCVCVLQDPLSLWPLQTNLEKLIHPNYHLQVFYF